MDKIKTQVIVDEKTLEGKKITVDGREYTIEGEVDLFQYPNVQKYSRRVLGLKGKRGAHYSLTQRISGSWWMQSLGSARTWETFEVEGL